MNILHIAIDQKFIPFVQKSFEKVWPGTNRFIILNNKKNNKWKYTENGENAKVGNSTYFFSNQLKQDLAWSDLLIIHYMTPWSAYAALKAHKDLPVLWSGWGGDYYHLIPNFTDEDLTLPNTKKIQQEITVEPTNFKKTSFYNVVKDIFIKNIFIKDSYSKVISRINYFSSPIPEDYDLMVKSVPKFTAKFIQLNYASVDDALLPDSNKNNVHDILVGNSATASNNHVEIFELLSSIKFSCKVVVPLSYGDLSYRDKLLELGQNLLGERFWGLTDFMELEKYNAILSNCKIAIMNQKRQQGLGNILVLLANGSKIYLREDNPLFLYFKNNGVYVYSISEISEAPQGLFTPLTENEININRSFVNLKWGECNVLNNIKKLKRIIKN